jgi:hypothetical protein
MPSWSLDPQEQADAQGGVALEEALATIALALEDWVAPVPGWELSFREGLLPGRPSNIEARLVFSGTEHTCSVQFRLDQVDGLQEVGLDLLVLLEERDGVAKAVRLSANGLDVEFAHVPGS